MTPNQFEAELLTGRSITGVQGALEAAQQLLEAGPHTVVSGAAGTPAATHMRFGSKIAAVLLLSDAASVLASAASGLPQGLPHHHASIAPEPGSMMY